MPILLQVTSMKKLNFVPQRLRESALVLIVLMVALTGIVSPAQVKQSSLTSIENFGKVNDNYYRGSQPDEEEVEQLKTLGIKTVIDLRKDYKAKARSWVTAQEMQYFNIPLKASRAATEEQTKYFLDLVNDPKNWPVYVHCKGGRHRTGALTASYRITHDGWTAERAFAEMKDYDFDNGFFGGPSAQKRFVFSFYERQNR